AAKYTDSGGRIWLTARREGRRVLISVRDDGTGIAPEKLPEMFALFAQGDRSLARSEGGLGIGLTVVRRLAEMHGGDVTAHSAGPNRGSEFVVSLPLAERPAAAESESEPEAQLAPAEAGPGARVLVVDDNVDTARGMARLLKLLGHEVLAIHDGRAAVEAARAFRPGFVLLDIGLPGLDGYEVARGLRQDERSRDAVIIAVSGYGQEDDRRRSRAAGFDHHLVKPVDFDALISLLGRPT
ncbi:MAG: luxQ 8, partial [Planctomycetota bacterium]|nr:luxQ 8 [Planctomycetota bacterium]